MPLLTRLIGTRGLELLCYAKVYSEDAGWQPWHFGVEVPSLVEGGLSITDLRWLIAKGYAAHAEETTRRTNSARNFRGLKALAFPPRACLVLTDTGFDAVKSLLASPEMVSRPSDSLSDAAAHLGLATIENCSNAIGQTELLRSVMRGERKLSGSSSATRKRSKGPRWNPDLHELRLGPQLVKRFTRPATSQELILAAFEEEGWPEVIDDPLPMNRGRDAKRRLHYTVYHLNRRQRPFLIQFYVNGGGQRVYWRSAKDRRLSGARCARKRS